MNLNLFIGNLLMQITFIFAFIRINKTEKDWNIKKHIIISIIFIVSAIAWMALNQILNNAITSLIFLLYFIVLFKFTFGMPLKKVVINILVIWTIFVIFDVVIMLCISLLHDLNVISEAYNHTFIATLFLLVASITFYSIKPIVRQLEKFLSKILKVNFSLLKLITIVAFFVALAIICYVNLDFFKVPLIINTTIIIFLFVVIFIVNQEYKIYTLIEKNNNILENNKKLTKVVDENRIFKHNLTSKLNGVKSVVNKDAKNLINEIILSYNNKYETIKDLSKIPDGINGIVYEKIYSLKDENVSIVTSNQLKDNLIQSISPKSYSLLCETLGVCLDNALEAVVDSKDKALLLNIEDAGKEIKIEIINTFSNEIDIDALGTMNYTTKKKGHGLGLFSLFERNNLRIKTKIINDTFRNEIFIKKLENKNQ